MTDTLKEEDWRLLLYRIRQGRCLPFLGAGACAGALPLGSEIARKWAEDHDYPLGEPRDLARVAQFLAVKYDDAMFPKEMLLELIKDRQPPDFNAPDEPHGVLARLPLPIYMTTNYDDFMCRALRATPLAGAGQTKQPVRELCRWNKEVHGHPSEFDSGYMPSVEKPVVFHMHGSDDAAKSLVLTEDDYLDFLVQITKDPQLLPKRIEEAFADSTLLFLGYGLADWNFRVLFRALVEYLQKSTSRAHVSVQLLPVSKDMTDREKESARGYLDKYFGNLKIHVFWGSCREFVAELGKRWKAYADGV